MVRYLTKILYLIAYILLIYTLMSYIVMPVSYVSGYTDRLYAGYYYGGSYDNFWGVKGKIKTVDFDMGDNGYIAAEWISVIFQYYPYKYWLQAGYYKYRIVWIIFEYTFYVEVNHPDYGHQIYKFSGLTEGKTYKYLIYSLGIYSDPINPIDPRKWRAVIDPSGYNHVKNFYFNNLYVGIDLQAFVEIDSLVQSVPYSHFSALKFYNGGWKFWDGHVKRIDYPPFHLMEVSSYEFYVWT